MSKALERAYESIRGYVPDEVNRVISNQIPKIENYIEEETDKFGKRLSEYIESQVAEEVTKIESELNQTKDKLIEGLDRITKEISDADNGLLLATKDLKENIDAYEEKFAKLGGVVKTAVNNGIRSAGIPLV